MGEKEIKVSLYSGDTRGVIHGRNPVRKTVTTELTQCYK